MRIKEPFFKKKKNLIQKNKWTFNETWDIFIISVLASERLVKLTVNKTFRVY